MPAITSAIGAESSFALTLVDVVVVAPGAFVLGLVVGFVLGARIIRY
jgi:hypothetical protein